MYSTKYILAFENELNEFYEIFFDFLNYTGPVTAIYGADDCLKIQSVAGDDNKLQPILGQEAQINVLVGPVFVNGVTYANDQLTINDLIVQVDNDIRVSIYYNKDYSYTIFQGFVSVQDNSQPFLDPPYILSITAVDALSLLKNVDMVDGNGNLFSGVLSVEDWIGNMLNKTGQTLNLRVYFPFYPSGGSFLPPLQQIFLDASTWSIGEITSTTNPSIDVFASEAVDVLTALTSIARCFRARIFQQNGVWNFVSLYAHADPNGFTYNESEIVEVGGIVHMQQVGAGSGLNYDVPIGYDQIVHPTQDDGTLSLKLATKWVQLNYNYDQSNNKVCNQSLTQGNRDTLYDGTITSAIYDSTINPAVTFQTQGYDAFCFSLLDSTSANQYYPGETAHETAFIREIIDALGYTVDRFLVITQGVQPYNAFLVSSTFKADINDIVQLSFSWRTYNNIHTTAGTLREFPCCALYLAGVDGSYWALDDISTGITGTVQDQFIWRSTDSNYVYANPGNTPYSPQIRTGSINDTGINWNDVSVNTTNTATAPYARMPVSGNLTLLLTCQHPLLLNANVKEVWFKNFKLTIVPFLQGSYQEIKGDYNFSSSINNIKQTVTETVELSDSPKRYFKGALVSANGNIIPPTYGRSGVLEEYRFTQLMGRVYWNNVNRINQKIEGTFRGLTRVNSSYKVEHIGYMNSYFFTDHPTPTKKFVLTSFEKNYTTGSGRHVFVEMLADQNDTGFANPGDPAIGEYVFNYVFQ